MVSVFVPPECGRSWNGAQFVSMNLVFVASRQKRSINEKELRLGESNSGYCVLAERHVCSNYCFSELAL